MGASFVSSPSEPRYCEALERAEEMGLQAVRSGVRIFEKFWKNGGNNSVFSIIFSRDKTHDKYVNSILSTNVFLTLKTPY